MKLYFPSMRLQVSVRNCVQGQLYITDVLLTACRPLGRPSRRWKDNIKMDIQEVGWGGMYWIDLAQGRDRWRAVVNVVMNYRVPQNAGNFLTS